MGIVHARESGRNATSSAPPPLPLTAAGLIGRRFWRRFWAKVVIKPAPECWEWQAFRNKQGYGSIGLPHQAGIREHRPEAAHRLSYMLFHGWIPPGRQSHVCHRCDNPPCCNPDHLFLGSDRENRADCDRKGRGAKGERHGNHVLSTTDVVEIRRRCRVGAVSFAELADTFGVSKNHIRRVASGRAWRHIEGGVA